MTATNQYQPKQKKTQWNGVFRITFGMPDGIQTHHAGQGQVESQDKVHGAD
jgi:hypothetical protein